MIASPEPIRVRFWGQKLPGMPAAVSLRVHSSWGLETITTVRALRSLARRFRALSIETAEHQKAIVAIVRSWRPDLLEQLGVGTDRGCHRALRLVPPRPIHSEAAFAMLAGVATIPANSGEVTNR